MGCSITANYYISVTGVNQLIMNVKTKSTLEKFEKMLRVQKSYPIHKSIGNM